MFLFAYYWLKRKQFSLYCLSRKPFMWSRFWSTKNTFEAQKTYIAGISLDIYVIKVCMAKLNLFLPLGEVVQAVVILYSTLIIYVYLI